MRRGERGAEAPGRLPPRSRLLAVAAGGAIGGTLRYAFVRAAPHDAGMFPSVTFAENVVGAFLLGLILALLLGLGSRADGNRASFLTTGILGSFTTFSNFTFESVDLVRSGAVEVALVYAFLSVMAGLAAAAVGLAVGRAVAARTIARRPS